MKYYVELSGFTKDDPNFFVYVTSNSVKEIESMFCRYDIICIDQIDQERLKMSKGWYVKVDTQVVFNVDTNIGVVAETEEKAGLEAQKIVSERLDRHGYKDVLEKGLPCDIEMGGAIWHRGAETADIDFDTMQVWSVTQDSDFDPDPEEMKMTKLKKGLQRQELIEALMKFAEQTGNDWYEWEEWIETDVQLCVVFTVEEEGNDD